MFKVTLRAVALLALGASATKHTSLAAAYELTSNDSRPVPCGLYRYRNRKSFRLSAEHLLTVVQCQLPKQHQSDLQRSLYQRGGTELRWSVCDLPQRSILRRVWA
jgi:type IV secretory pathway protease TraF